MQNSLYICLNYCTNHKESLEKCAKTLPFALKPGMYSAIESAQIQKNKELSILFYLRL